MSALTEDRPSKVVGMNPVLGSRSFGLTEAAASDGDADADEWAKSSVQAKRTAVWDRMVGLAAIAALEHGRHFACSPGMA